MKGMEEKKAYGRRERWMTGGEDKAVGRESLRRMRK